MQRQPSHIIFYHCMSRHDVCRYVVLEVKVISFEGLCIIASFQTQPGFNHFMWCWVDGTIGLTWVWDYNSHHDCADWLGVTAVSPMASEEVAALLVSLVSSAIVVLLMLEPSAIPALVLAVSSLIDAAA